MTTCGKAARMKAKRRSRARKEASAEEVRGYYKQFAEAKHREYKSWVVNEVSDLIDMRKVRPRKLRNRTMGAHRQDRQTRQLPWNKGKMGVERFPRQTAGISTDRFHGFHKTRISHELSSGSQQKFEHLSH